MGGKAAALASLSRAELQSPSWFVISPEAFEVSLSASQHRALQTSCTQSELTDLFAEVAVAPQVLEEVEQSRALLLDNAQFVAVRSSGVQEDGFSHSFAGQLESFLNVAWQQLPTRIVDVWRSGFSDRLLAYRSEHGFEGLPQAPAVLIQEMVDGEVSGVAFSADPVTGDRSLAVVSALFGLATALVGGDSDADTYRVEFDGAIFERSIVSKKLAHRLSSNNSLGYEEYHISEPEASNPALTDEQASQIAELARRTATHFGVPQDIEWTIRDNEIYLLQSRPITSLRTVADPVAVRTIWDNSNIIESYNGITTPLTFSFALHAYEGVYRAHCRLMGVSERKIMANDFIFRGALGLVRGRVYYNLLNWYRGMALLPGYTFNRGFMEQMMGVRETLPTDIGAAVADASRTKRLVDLVQACRTVATLIVHSVRLPHTIESFQKRLDRSLMPPDPPFSARRLDQLVADYRRLEATLLPRWDAPLLNDLFAMFFFGVLGHHCKKWCPTEHLASLQNDLVTAQGGMVSAEPARRIVEMAKIAAREPALTELLSSGSVANAEHSLNGHKELSPLYKDYLLTFGDRCLDELKLESPTLLDDPEPLIRAIGRAAARHCHQPYDSRQTNVSQDAEKTVRRSLRGHPLRRAVFSWVLHNARNRVRDRENLRFERTRLFGRARTIFCEIGRRFVAEGVLDDANDIFYLELNEVLGFVEGTATCDDLRSLAAVRRQAFERYATCDTPADRFETFGAPYIANTFQETPNGQQAKSENADTTTFRGIGCCHGVVRGPARVIRDPRSAVLQHGEILVAERTDPGWIMLFPTAAGIVVERGSLLSHSAIVAREMGIPAVVSVTGITKRIDNGQLIEMDGARGVVTLIAESSNRHSI